MFLFFKIDSCKIRDIDDIPRNNDSENCMMTWQGPGILT